MASGVDPAAGMISGIVLALLRACDGLRRRQRVGASRNAVVIGMPEMPS